MDDVPALEAVNELLACRECSSSRFAFDAAVALCTHCGAQFPLHHGVVDFVAGGQATSLDTGSYDAFHRVDERLDSAFESVRSAIGGPLGQPLGTALEVGAGTGLFTAGLLRNMSIGTLVVTDISPEMLRICRERIRRTTSSTARLLFATNNGEYLCAAPGKYDLVIGHFVVHHVLEYEKTLKAAFDAVAENGFAIFVEPAYKFHTALYLTLSRVVERMWRSRETWTERELDAVTSLHREWHHNLKYADHRRFLATQEDKHFFDRRVFLDAASRAGWAHVHAIPFGFEDPLQSAAGVYLSQIGLSPLAFHRVIDLFESEFPGPFRVLDADDSAASVAFVLTKSAAYVPPIRGQQRKQALIEAPDRKTLYDIKLFVEGSGRERTVGVDGWICARRPVLAVVISAGGVSHELPVGRTRSDVLIALSSSGAYQFESLLYSGVYSSGLRLPPGPITVAARFAETGRTDDVQLASSAMDSGSFRVKRLD